MEAGSSNYDCAWKETLELYWEPFLRLCFPTVAAGIDWHQPCEFLDQELHEVVRDAESGRRYVDKLAKVTRNDGVEQWVLVHVEVQSEADPHLAARMYQYHQRLTDRYQRPVASLAVLADERPDWRPEAHEAELWGCRLRFEYPVCKLLNLDDGALDRSDNPVAVVIAAQRAAQRTVRDPTKRARMKMQLVRRLYERELTRKDVLELFRLIDWQISLPAPWEIDFRRELAELEEEKAMPYVTSIERLGRQEGRQEGLQEGLEKGCQVGRIEAAREDILEVLSVRFGVVPTDLAATVLATSNPAQLRQWHRLAVTASSVATFREAIQERAGEAR